MKMEVYFKDGSFTELDVKWHPQFTSGGIGTGGSITIPAGLWIEERDIIKHLEEVNAKRKRYGVRRRNLSNPRRVIKSISYGEAPLEIYESCEMGEPWRHNGLLIRIIPSI